MTTLRVPPASAELEFFANNKTRRVHVHQWAPGYREEGWEETEPLGFAEGLALMATTPATALCGVRLLLWGEAEGHWTDDFDSADLCIACHRVMDDQAWRIFEHCKEERDDPKATVRQDPGPGGSGRQGGGAEAGGR